MEEAEKPDVKLAQDWHPDHFPTSAKKVFIGWGVMLGGILLLCLSVYLSSEHPTSEAKAKPKTDTAQINNFGDAEEE